MSLQSRLASLIASIGADIKSLNARAPAGTVTVLPGSPVDGQVVNFLADAANGVIWQLRWRAAGGTYKWEFVGGSPMKHRIDADEFFPANSGVYMDATTGGPVLTLPLPGEYRYEFTANLWVGGQTLAAAGACGLNIDGVAPAGPNVTAAVCSDGVSETMTKIGEFTVLTSGRVVKMQYNLPPGSGTGMHTRWRHLMIRPIRCGAA